MSVHLSSYNTAKCGGYKVTQLIEEAKRECNLYNSTTLINGVHVFTPNTKMLAAFAHPLYMDNGNILVDGRPFMRWDVKSGEAYVTNQIELDTLIRRAQLELIYRDDPARLHTGSPIPLKVFSRWIGTQIRHRFNLDPLEQQKIELFSGYYYLCLFETLKEIPDRNYDKMIGMLSKTLSINAEECYTLLDPIRQEFADLPMLIEQLKTITIRLEDLNIGVFFAALGGSWFGVNGPEVLAVALEHPPTWLAILLTSQSVRTYKDTALSRMLATQQSSQVEQWTRQVLGLCVGFN
jgi:hypothetical protein